MGCVNLNAKQKKAVAEYLLQWSDYEVWIHGEFESVYVEVEDSNGKTFEAKRFFEDGTIRDVGLDF